MSASEPDWIAAAIDVALQRKPVAAAVAATVKTELSGRLRAQPLRPTDLAALAKNLLELSSDAQAETPK